MNKLKTLLRILIGVLVLIYVHFKLQHIFVVHKGSLFDQIIPLNNTLVEISQTVPQLTLPHPKEQSQNFTSIDQKADSDDGITSPNINNDPLRSQLEDYDKQFNNTLITSKNFEGLPIKVTPGNKNGTVKEILCALKNNPLTFLDNATSPYREMGFAKYFNSILPSEMFLPVYETCAVVSSSQAMTNTSFGKEIDDHDAVFRSNIAPVDNYTTDVGNKTTFRILNSHALDLLDNRILKDTILNNGTFFIWRTGPYNGNLYRWYIQKEGPEFFQAYARWRRAFPNMKAFIIHPASQWRQWDTVQRYSSVHLHRHVLSTGFTCIAVALQLCNTIDLYGFNAEKDYIHHYYDINLAPMSVSSFHPTIQEKQFIEKIKTNRQSKKGLERYGPITLQGFPTISSC